MTSDALAGARPVYVRAVNRVVDRITSDPAGDLSVHTLAQVAGFSPYHFHRLFGALMGEPLGAFVRRARLERAARLLKAAPSMSVSEVALRVGFQGLPQFTRAFGDHFGVPPGRWDRRSPLEVRKIGKAGGPEMDYDPHEFDEDDAAPRPTVRVERLPPRRVAYVRVLDPYGNPRLVDTYHAVARWVEDQGLDRGDVVFVGSAVDDPAITPLERCRYDLGIVVPLDDEPSLLRDVYAQRGVDDGALASLRERAGGWSRGAAPGGGMSIVDRDSATVAAVHCAGDLAVEERALRYLYGRWLPRSPWLPADAPASELFRRLPEEIGWDRFDLELVVPIETIGGREIDP